MIAIPAFHHTEVRKHQVEFPHALQQDLEQYRQFYRTIYGAEVKEPDLIREIVRCFLEHDEAFRGYKRQAKWSGRQRRSSAASDPSKSPNGPNALNGKSGANLSNSN